MIEIAAALAAAEAAVGGIKRAIKVGKEANECLQEFMQLFDARDAVQKASNEERAKHAGKSAMSEAMESVIAARKIQQMETELREFLIWSGQDDVWDAIVQERNAVIARRKAAELAAQRAAELKIKRRKEVGLVAFAVGLGGLFLYHIVQYIISAWPAR
jgi:hypothetical protein